jgi:tight adherence protein C
LVYLGAAVLAAGLFVIVWSLGQRAQLDSDPLTTRLKIYDKPGLTEHELELETTGFADRVLVPVVQFAGSWLAARTPDNQRASIQSKLDLAGRPGGLGAEEFLALRIGLGVGLFLGGLFLGVLLANPMVEALGAAVGGGLGYYAPTLWINQKVGDRRNEIQKSLPDCMDLLTISVEAGLSFDAAIQRVVEKFNNALAEEFRTTITEVQLGRPRFEALDGMGRRCGVEDLHNFIQAVIQSEQMGVGLARILRLQSEEMRRKRRQRAQEKAAQATLKMMLPMVGCIFPTLWIVLLGPAILILMKRGT